MRLKIIIVLLVTLMILTALKFQKTSYEDKLSPMYSHKIIKLVKKSVSETVISNDKKKIQLEISLTPNMIKESIIANYLETMTLEEKVAQLFFVDFRVTENQVVKFEQIEAFLKKYPVGGFIYFDENIKNKNQVINLNTNLQNYYKLNNLPSVFIGVDEEGGLVSRLTNKGLAISSIPLTSKLSTYSEEKVYAIALKLGKEMSVLGFNVNFAPVLDVNNNASNKVIADRAFSDKASLVAKYGSAFSKGLEKNLLSFGKHFPGHGNTSGDSHLLAVKSTITKNDFDNVEGIPFKYAINEGISGIMLGHINVPNLVNDKTVASLNSDVINILRDEMNFDGLIITDSLQMKAITKYYKSSEVAVKAYRAGVDLILMPDDFIKSYTGLLNMFYKNELSLESLDERVYRILNYKYKEMSERDIQITIPVDK